MPTPSWIVYLVSGPNYFWSQSGIAPDDSTNWLEVEIEGRLTPAQVEGIGSGEQKVWLDGVVFYEDVFGASRETHFCWVYDPGLDMMVAERGAGLNRYI